MEILLIFNLVYVGFAEILLIEMHLLIIFSCEKDNEEKRKIIVVISKVKINFAGFIKHPIPIRNYITIELNEQANEYLMNKI